MAVEFVLWLLAAALCSSVLQYTTSLETVTCLLIGAFSMAAVFCLVDILRNRRFRRSAQQEEATVLHVLPPLRMNGPARVQISCPSSGKSSVYTFTPEGTSKPGDKIEVWILGRRILAKKPTHFDDFRMFLLCLAATALLGLAFLCTKLLPSLSSSS